MNDSKAMKVINHACLDTLHEHASLPALSRRPDVTEMLARSGMVKVHLLEGEVEGLTAAFCCEKVDGRSDRSPEVQKIW